MKQKKILFFVASSILTLGVLTPFMLKESNALEPDNAVYDNNNLIADYNHPDEVYAPKIKKAVTSATSIEIHYHNDDGKNATREFWVWCDGVNGSAFAPTNVSSDGKDMTLSFSFSGTYANFAKKKSISFIVKYKEGWVGQSENIVVKYEDYAPNDSGCCVLWCVPGEGNAVEIYKTKEESEAARFQAATFTDWKTIYVIADDVPTYYKLYALTSSYMRMGQAEKIAKLPNYLVAQGENPSCSNVEYNSKKDRKTFNITLPYTAHPNVQYMLVGEFSSNKGVEKTKYVSFDKLYSTERFTTYYNYSGTDLGATYNDENSTTFKVWAPTAARVRVKIYDSGTPENVAELYTDVEGSDSAGGYNMAYQPGGVWETTIKGKDLKGKYYT